ncbi:MAG: hypothetical protein WDN69_28785 [Aliidongia sp.]
MGLAAYLHNGSVPTIYALLSPAKERPAKFYLGRREYDPVNLGYQYGELSGGFEFDTTIPGNRNSGHEFDNAPMAAALSVANSLQTSVEPSLSI